MNLTRSEEVRSANDRIAKRAAGLHFVSRVPMLCECSDPSCQSFVLISLGRYAELRKTGFFTVPSHTLDGAEPAAEDDGFWLQRS